MIFDEAGIFPLHGYIPWFCIWLCSPQACNNNNNNKKPPFAVLQEYT